MNKGYLRVSSTRQQEGLSLAAQKRAIRDYLKGAEVQFYQDIGTGRNGNRKQLKQMMKGLQRDDRVIVFKLDRISRSPIDLWKMVQTFEQKGVIFLSTRESIEPKTAAGRAFLGMLAIFAAWESDCISERTLNSMAEARAKNKWLGGNIPYGWSRKQGHLSLIEEEQKVIRLMTRWREKEKLSYDKIAKRLMDRLIAPKQNGSRWWGDNVNSIIKRNRELKELLEKEAKK